MGPHGGVLPANAAPTAEPTVRRRRSGRGLPAAGAPAGPPHRRPGRRLLRAARRWPAAVDAEPAVPARAAGRPRPGRCWPTIDAGAPLEPAADGAVGAGGPPPAGTGCGPRCVGMLTTARKLAGEHIGYADEVEACYGVRPTRVDEEVLAGGPPAARRGAARDRAPGRAAGRLAGGARRPRRPAAARPSTRWPRTCGSGPAPCSACPTASGSSSSWCPTSRGRGSTTTSAICSSRVAVNTDLPVLSTGLAHLVAHEAYPGHHTEHTRKEVGLVRRRQWWEESIFLVGTPAVPAGRGPGRPGSRGGHGPSTPRPIVADHLPPARDPLRRRGGGGGGRGRRGARGRAPERRLPAPRGRGRPDGGDGRGGPLGSAVPGPGAPRRSSS